MKILIGGDVVPTKKNIKYFENGKMENVISEELIKRIKDYDFRIINLECPLFENNSPISKSGPVLYSSSKCINGIKSLNIDLVCLANNHILDEGIDGLQHTINVLNKNKISNIGAGEINKISNYYMIPNTNIMIYNCCDCEFNYIRNYTTNIFDFIDTFDEIESLKSNGYNIIVIYHGGKEYYRYPSPNLQKICHKFVKCGASIVLCQHSHCVGTYETYHNGKILYGQGNFIFNRIKNEMNQQNLLVEVTVDKNNELNWNFKPIKYDGDTLQLMPENESTEFLKMLDMDSRKIMDKDFINNEYKIVAKKDLDIYVGQLNGTDILKRIHRKIHKNCFNERDFNNILNILQCDVHRETLITALRNQKKLK